VERWSPGALEPGLDRNALLSALQWEFEPGSFNWKPTPVLIVLVQEYRMH
jgi:hypothetical protein